MDYEDIPSRPIHKNAGRPDQQVLRTEPADDEFEMDKLLQDVDSVSRTLLALYPDMEIDPNMVFEQLEVVRHSADRVFHVVSLLSQLHRTFLNNKAQRGVIQTENDEPVKEKDAEPEGADNKTVVTVIEDEQTGNSDSEDEHPVITIIDETPEWKDVYGGLVQDVNTIMDVFPDADPQEVYAYLEARRQEPERVANVIEELIHRNPVEKSAVVANVPPAKQNVSSIPDEERKRRMATEMDLYLHKKLRVYNEIQTEPSQHYVKSPLSITVDDDVQGMEKSSNLSPAADANSSSSIAIDQPSTSAGSSGQEEILSANQQLLSRLQVLKDTFPDADREYLSELINSCGTDEAKLQASVSDMLENKAYPKLKDQLERERKKALKKEYSSRIFSPEEVLQWFEDPIAFFGNNSTPVSKSYELHAYAQLYNEFPKLILLDIKKALINNNQHYTAAFHELTEKLQEECKTPKFKRRKPRATMALPDEPDELFYKELAFTRIEDKFKEYLQSKETHKKKRMEEAKANGELVTCACCFDDEILPEEMIDCGLGHLFCRECVRRGAEVAVGDGKSELDCMSDKCGAQFELPALQMVLKPSTFSNLLKRIQAEEISNAEIPDLVQCPHCSFAAIMPNQDDKVFRCLNPECLKETCRFCKEPNHIPLRCEEVEKSDEVKMRTYIEDKMTDALVRKCYRCSRRFMKEEGCNKMTCVCGATMCYVCRQPIKDYQHFQKGGCPQMSDTFQLHHDEVLQGAEKAKKEFVEQHPELKDTKLRHDPTKDLLNGENPTRVPGNKYDPMHGIVHELMYYGGFHRAFGLRHDLDGDLLGTNFTRGRDDANQVERMAANHNLNNEMQQDRNPRYFAYPKLQARSFEKMVMRRSQLRPMLAEPPLAPKPLAAVDLTQRIRKETEAFDAIFQTFEDIQNNCIKDLDAQLPRAMFDVPIGKHRDVKGVSNTLVTQTSPATNSAISSTSSRASGSFNVQMKPARLNPPNLEKYTISSDVRKRGVILSKADSSSSTEMARFAPMFPFIGSPSFSNGTAWNDNPAIAGQAVPIANLPKLHLQPNPYPPIQPNPWHTIDYSTAGPSSRLNLTSKKANGLSSASSLQQSPNGPPHPLDIELEEGCAVNMQANSRHAALATELSVGIRYFQPNTNQTPVYVMPTVNGSASNDYQPTEPSTSNGRERNQNVNWTWRNPASTTIICDKSNAPSNQ